MMFNLKAAFLLGLAAVSVASPAPSSDLVVRAKVPDSLTCDGKTWSKAQINASKSQARNLENDGYAYPKTFGNKDGKGNAIFNTQGQLWEFPLTDPVWKSQ